MLQRVLLTPQGHQKLQDELDHHKKVLRPQVIQEIAEARSHGDLSENAEYDYAKDRQGMIEARIAELETSMALAEVIDVRRLAPSDEVVFGSRVKLVDLDTDEELEYQIVGKLESDVKQNRISFSSPVGKAMLNRHVGDEVVVNTPKRTRYFEILEVSYR